MARQSFSTARAIGPFCRLARRAGVPAEISRDAGDYLCNESFYLSLLMDRRAAFIHLRTGAGRRWTAPRAP